MRAQLCRLHLSSEVLAAMTRHLQVFAACTGAVDQAPTDRASLRLLHSASRRRRQGVCSSLPLAVEFRCGGKVRARHCRLHFSTAPVVCYVSVLRNLGSAPQCESEAEARCVLIFAACT